MFHRLCKLLYFGIKPVIVFDGEVPMLKQATMAKRKYEQKQQERKLKLIARKLLKLQMKSSAVDQVKQLIAKNKKQQKMKEQLERKLQQQESSNKQALESGGFIVDEEDTTQYKSFEQDQTTPTKRGMKQYETLSDFTSSDDEDFNNAEEEELPKIPTPI